MAWKLRLGQFADAIAACRAWRASFPDDAELLLLEGQLLHLRGDLRGAERCLLRLQDPTASSDPILGDSELRRFKGRHQLALVYKDQGRVHDAEQLWQAVLVDEPRFWPALLELGRLYLQQRRWQQLESIAVLLDHHAQTAGEGTRLRAGALLARREGHTDPQFVEPSIPRPMMDGGRTPKQIMGAGSLAPRLTSSGRLWERPRARGPRNRDRRTSTEVAIQAGGEREKGKSGAKGDIQGFWGADAALAREARVIGSQE